jgi:hypothetical protein
LLRLPALAALFAALLAALLAAPAVAGTLHVDVALTTGANDGSSWADAFQGPLGLRDALAAALPGDQVFVRQGTYPTATDGSRGASFVMANDVGIYGGFLGTESSPEERPPFGTAPTVLTGDQFGDDGLGLFDDNSYHVLRAPGTDASALLDGFEVRGGAATGVGSNQDRGGGILLAGGVSPTLRHCRFVGNRSTFGGGAGYVNNGSAPSFTDCSFEDGLGGAFGGAFDIAGGGAVRFERCLFKGNSAARAGALEIFSTNGVVVDNCVFVGNTSTGSGGGGALWMGSGGNTRVRHCTIVGNASTVNAVGGVLVSGAAATTIANCILWDNAGPGGAQGTANQVNAAANVTYSIVEGGFAGTGNLGADPALADVAGGDYAPTAGSPAIDAGDNASLEPGVTLDFAGQPRLADVLAVADTGAGAAPVTDMGAIEFPSAWLDLGQGLAGAGGVPRLLATGTLEAGSPGTLSLTLAAPGAPAALFVALSGAGAAFKCGTLVPVPANLQVVLVTNGAGSIPLGWAGWPAGLEGFGVHFQYAVQDAAAACGVALSNALRGDVP